MFSYQNLYSLGAQSDDRLGDVQQFRRVDRSGFNITDSNDTRFFKLMFYFYNEGYEDNTNVEWYNGGPSGLLAPTWIEHPELDNGGDYYKYNSAWAYLKNNYEEERADILKTFIQLLSDISSKSPWYFQKITGVDEALTREKWKPSEERKKITIECLADPVDHRIESLLSMYRSVVWSHSHKCEVIPANLRKFDMGLFVFSGLISGLYNKNVVGFDDNGRTYLDSRGKQTEWMEIGHMTSPQNTLYSDRAAYKYIEFHNCEINIDSIKSGYGDLSNAEGSEQTFNIEIYFDDCYEYNYNPFVLRVFGDFFIWDMWESGRSSSGDVASHIPEDDISEMSNPKTPLYQQLEKGMNAKLRPKRKIEPLENGTSISARAEALKKSNINTDDTPDKPSTALGDYLSGIGENAKYAAARVYDHAKQSAANVVNTAKQSVMGTINNAVYSTIGTLASGVNSIINMITGDLGNIYKNGYGVTGGINAVNDELNQQIKSLANKITGNINNTTTTVSRNVTSNITSPVLGTIQSAGSKTIETVDKTANTVNKEVLGELYNKSNDPILFEDHDLGSVVEDGDYDDYDVSANEGISNKLGDIFKDIGVLVNESENLGTIYKVSSGSVAKNRLQSNIYES